MAKKTDIKTCRYKQCKHATKDIDITQDEYVAKGNMYYHKDCYKAKVSGEWKDENTKKDLQFIKTLWLENISKTVVYSQLFRTLNDLLARGIESDYLVFTLQYCIEHKLNLNYPAGFPYFVDKKEIKETYAKKKLASSGYNKNSFVAVENDDTAPKFSVNKKPNGFQSILKNNG